MTTRYDGTGTWQVTTSLVDTRYRPTRITYTVPASVTGLAGSYSSGYGYHIDGTLASTSFAAGGGPASA